MSWPRSMTAYTVDVDTPNAWATWRTVREAGGQSARVGRGGFLVITW